MQNGMEWIFGSFYRFYIGTANIEFECCLDFRISGVQDGVGVVEQNGVRVVGSLFSNRLDKYECRMGCRVGILLSAQTMLNTLSGIMRMSESVGVLRYSWVERPSTAPPNLYPEP